MSRIPSSSLLYRTQDAQTDVMGDLCNLLRMSFTQDSYGDPIEGVTGTYSVPCGIIFTNGMVTERNQVFLVEYDAILRLDVTQSVQLTDRFQLVSKGTTMVSGTFEVFGYPKIGPTATTVLLKRITP